MITHELAERIKAAAVVPLTPLPVTAKAYAVLRRAGVTYVPDFVALAAPLLASCDGDERRDPVERVRATVSELASKAGPTRGSSRSAWPRRSCRRGRTTLPFGRPLAT